MTGRMIESYHIFSAEALLYVERARDRAKASVASSEESPSNFVAIPHSYNHGDSSSEGDEELAPSSSSSESSSESESDGGRENDKQPSLSLPTGTSDEPSNKPTAASKHVRPKKAVRQDKQNRQRTQQVKQFMDNLAYVSLPIDETTAVAVPQSLLTKESRRMETNFQLESEEAVSLASNLGGKTQKLITILLVRSGRFAGGIFEGNRCLTHRAFQHYTVRKGQGKAQSSLDNSKRKAKSMGAQLRRAGEQSLREDIQETIREWKDMFQRSCLVLVSCPKTMKTTLFSDTVEDVISRNDPRIRKIPFDLGRPTFHSVCVAHEVMTTVKLREVTHEIIEEDTQESHAKPKESLPTVPEKVEETKEKSSIEVIPLSALHEASRQGDLSNLLCLLNNQDDNAVLLVDQQAGVDFMAPLHFAAESSQVVDPGTAAGCVSALLIQGRANPCVLDLRGRLPYFLATHEMVRVAFRKARAILGEGCWNWEEAKVGPPLTDEDIHAKKEKEAEKKKKKKARQKEKKAQEKAKAEEMEKRKIEEEEKKQQMENAKRVRDGLQPKANTDSNVCDFCQTVLKGRKRQQIFKRLDYNYCSTDCVQEHKRELMARAAMARFKNN